MTTKTVKAVFAWDDKNTAVAVKMYADSKNSNLKADLDKIAVAVGAKSAASVRAKLSSQKVYVKVEATATAGSKKTKSTKVELVQNVESILGLKRDSLDTLEKSYASVIAILTSAIVAKGTPEAIEQAYEDLMFCREQDEVKRFSDEDQALQDQILVDMANEQPEK